MSARLRGIARETEQIVAAGTYRAPSGREVRLAEAVRAARDGTRLYGPEPVRGPKEVPERASPARTRIEVTGESSLEAARRLAEDAEPGEPRREPAVLNFASAIPQALSFVRAGRYPHPRRRLPQRRAGPGGGAVPGLRAPHLPAADPRVLRPPPDPP